MELPKVVSRQTIDLFIIDLFPNAYFLLFHFDCTGRRNLFLKTGELNSPIFDFVRSGNYLDKVDVFLVPNRKLHDVTP